MSDPPQSRDAPSSLDGVFLPCAGLVRCHPSDGCLRIRKDCDSFRSRVPLRCYLQSAGKSGTLCIIGLLVAAHVHLGFVSCRPIPVGAPTTSHHEGRRVCRKCADAVIILPRHSASRPPPCSSSRSLHSDPSLPTSSSAGISLLTLVVKRKPGPAWLHLPAARRFRIVNRLFLLPFFPHLLTGSFAGPSTAGTGTTRIKWRGGTLFTEGTARSGSAQSSSGKILRRVS